MQASDELDAVSVLIASEAAIAIVGIDREGRRSLVVEGTERHEIFPGASRRSVDKGRDGNRLREIDFRLRHGRPRMASLECLFSDGTFDPQDFPSRC